jgi:hypothetical protein
MGFRDLVQKVDQNSSRITVISLAVMATSRVLETHLAQRLNNRIVKEWNKRINADETAVEDVQNDDRKASGF